VRRGESRKRCRAELKPADVRRMLEELAKLAAKGTLTVVCRVKDETHNRAVALREVRERMKRIGSGDEQESRRSAWN